MFRRSVFLVTLIVLMVFASAFASQMWITKDLPSAYDPGLSIEKAFKTSKAPLLIEFYSDSCGTCKTLTPVIHELQEGPYKNRLTLVMLDVSEPSNQDIARLFGVDALPGLYVFDHHHMKKHQIKPEEFTSKANLQQAIDGALAKTHLPATGGAPKMGAMPGNAAQKRLTRFWGQFFGKSGKKMSLFAAKSRFDVETVCCGPACFGFCDRLQGNSGF